MAGPGISDDIQLVASLDGAGVMVGLDDIEASLTSLESVTARVGANMTASLSGLDTSISELADWLDLVVAATDRVDTSVRALDPSLVSMRGSLNSIAADLPDVVSGLGDVELATNGVTTAVERVDATLNGMWTTLEEIAASSESAAASLESIDASSALTADQLVLLNEKMDVLIASIGDLEMRAPAAGAALRDMGYGAGEADTALGHLGGGLGGLLISFAGFGVILAGATALRDFGNAAFQGGIILEAFKQKLHDLNSSDAPALIAWTWKFGQVIPFTTQALQQATITIDSMGLSYKQTTSLLRDIASVAAATGGNIVDSATAVMQAFENNRWVRMTTQMRITRKELEAYGYIPAIPSTFIDAFNKLVAAKFPTSLTDALHTYAGEVSNLKDQFTQIAIVFGNPVFEVFRKNLFDLTDFLRNNRPAIDAVTTAIGQGLAKALDNVIGFLKVAVVFLWQHRDALKAVFDILAPLVGGGLLLKLGLGFEAMGVKMALSLGPFGLVALAILGLFKALQNLYNSSPAFRAAVDNIGTAFGKLWAAVQPLLGRLGDLAGEAGKLLDAFLHSPLVVDIANGLAAALQWIARELTPVGDGAQKTAPLVQQLSDGLGHLRDIAGQVAVALAGITLGAGIGAGILGLINLGGISGAFNALTGIVVAGLLPAYQAVAKLLALVGGPAGLVGALGEVAVAAAPFIGIALGIAAAVGAAAAAFIYLWNNVAGFRDMVGAALGGILSIFGTLKDAVGTVLGQLGDTIQTQIVPAWNQFTQALQGIAPFLLIIGAALLGIADLALGALVSAIKGVLDALGTFLAGVVRVFGGVAQVVLGALTGIINFFHDFWDFLIHPLDPSRLRKLGDDLAAAAQTIVDGLFQILVGGLQIVFGTVLSLLGGFVQGFGDWIEQMTQEIPVLGGAVKATGDALGWLGDHIGGALGAIGSAFDSARAQIQQFNSGTLIVAPDATTVAQSQFNILAWGNQLQTWIGGTLSNVTNAVNAPAQKVAQTIATNMMPNVTQINDATSQFVHNFLVNGPPKWTSVADDMAQVFQRGLQTQLARSFADSGNFAASAFVQWMATGGPAAYQSGMDMIKQFGLGLASQYWWVIQQVNNFLGQIYSLFHFSHPDEGPLVDWDQWPRHMMRQYAEGIKAGIPGVSDAVKQMANVVSAPIQVGVGGVGGGVVPFGGVPNALSGLGGPLTNSGVPLAGGAGGFGGGPGNVTVNATVQVSGSMGAGLALLSPAERHDLASYLAVEMGAQMRLQGISTAGTANANNH